MGQAVCIDMSVAMGNDFESQCINARHTGHRSICQTWQFATVMFRQVILGCLDLFLDEIEIVEKPFRSGCYSIFVADSRGQNIVYFADDGFVVGQSCKQAVFSRFVT